MKRTVYSIVFALFVCVQTFAQTKIQGLLTESSVTPLGIDEKKPTFTWQMSAMDRGTSQTAYQIVITDPKGAVAWDTKKVTSDISLNIPYAGSALKATTRYTWKVTVWDQKGGEASASSWFETGLMNPDPNLAAWNGATWIGGCYEDLVFYAHYLSIYERSYTQAISEGST